MIQLTFQPAFDPFHAVFRLLRLRSTIAPFGPLHLDHVRILDFYLLFPFRIEGIRLTPQHRRYRKLSSDYRAVKPYGHQPEDRVVFGRMELMQIAALETLAARELIAPEMFKIGQVEATAESAPEELASRVEAANEQEDDLVAFLGVLASEYGLTGANGLKDRTKLLDHRYDAV